MTSHKKHATVASAEYQARGAKMTQELRELVRDLPRREWRPLQVERHQRQDDIDAYRAIRSLQTK